MEKLSVCLVRVVIGNLLEVHTSRTVEVDCDIHTGASVIVTTDPVQ